MKGEMVAGVVKADAAVQDEGAEREECAKDRSLSNTKVL